MAAILLVGVSIEAAGLLAAYQAAALSRKMSAFSMFAAGIDLDGIRDPKKRNLRLFLVLAVSRPQCFIRFDLPYVMPCEGGQIYPSGASGGELGAALTGWRDCWRGCDFTSDDFYLFWLYAGAAVVSGRISAKQGAAAR